MLSAKLSASQRETLAVAANYLNISDHDLFGSEDARVVAASIRARVRKTAKQVMKRLREELAAGAAHLGRRDVKSKT
jgi:hypothetical protein